MSPRTPQAGDLTAYLNALLGAEPAGAFAELRAKRPGDRGMAQHFVPVRDTAAIGAAIAKLAPAADVYIGVAPRCRKEGKRSAVERCHVLWADCDGEEAVESLRRFRPLPSIVVASGTAGNVHAYWPLLDPVGPDRLEVANRQLAHAIGADVRSTDAPRILRPPGSLSHKGDSEPRAIVVRHLAPDVFRLEDVVGQLPPATSTVTGRDTAFSGEPRDPDPGDVLATVSPPTYVRLLTGADAPDRGGMIRCPLPDHEDRTPSCYVYPDAAAGWYCYGCGRGGSLVDLGAHLWGVDPRGRGYHDLRQRLARELTGMALPS